MCETSFIYRLKQARPKQTVHDNRFPDNQIRQIPINKHFSVLSVSPCYSIFVLRYKTTVS